MSFSADNDSREAIQAIQFELWPDCSNGCAYCYLNGTKRTTTVKEKKANIASTLSLLKQSYTLDKYNAVGLIGGEFFFDQLNGLEDDWYFFIYYLNTLMRCESIKEVWLASSLLFMDLKHVYDTLEAFEFDKFTPDQRVMLCTSYDTIGRFGDYNGDENTPNDVIWFENIKKIKEKYPKVNIHVQVIMTQDLLEKFIENPDMFDFITEYAMVDFRYPSVSRADCPSATVIEDYRSIMLKRLSSFPPKFFIENRSVFLKFLSALYNKYGLVKVQNLINQPKMRSRRLIIYVENVDIKDRWNDERDRFLPCGHLIDGLCYVDSEKCIYCDIEKFIENKENG